jgi:CHRD domain
MRNQWKIGGAAIVLTIAAAGLAAACGGDPVGSQPQTTTYMAHMSGANEVPAIQVGATGMATFTLTGKTLSYTVSVNGLSGNAAASHIHLGAAGDNGGIVFPFTAASLQSGQIASGTIDLTRPVSNGTSSISGDSLLTLLNNGHLYTNVHTAANPAGEIRGQIIRSSTTSGY